MDVKQYTEQRQFNTEQRQSLVAFPNGPDGLCGRKAILNNDSHSAARSGKEAGRGHC